MPEQTPADRRRRAAAAWPLPMPERRGRQGRTRPPAGDRRHAPDAWRGASWPPPPRCAPAPASWPSPPAAASPSWWRWPCPKSRVIGLPETGEGGIATRRRPRRWKACKGRLDAVLIGPGMQDEPAICEFVHALLPMLDGVNVILDAAAMGVVREAAASAVKRRFLRPLWRPGAADAACRRDGAPERRVQGGSGKPTRKALPGAWRSAGRRRSR